MAEEICKCRDLKELIVALEAKQEYLNTRCDKKETAIRLLEIQQSKLATELLDMQKDNLDYEKKVDNLLSWKNKAIGYLSAVAVLVGAIIEAFREKFIGG